MSESIKILLLENIHPTAHEMLKAEGFQVEGMSQALKGNELQEKLKDVHILGIRSKTMVTKEVLAAAPKLLGVGCFCIGTNQVNLVEANLRGVPVFNAPFSNTRSVAELIIAEIIMLARQLGDRSNEVHTGNWKKTATSCYEIRGKTLGIVGYGHIGSQLGVLAEAMGMRVIFYDVQTKLPMGNNRSCPALDALLAEADYVTLHVPETPQTKNMIGAAELGKMRKGSYLLNASRGTVVQIPELAEALRSGHLAGAAVDVYPEEPESNGEGFNSPLRGLSNVILTPHIGGSTAEAQAAIGREVATSILKFARGGTTTSSVNFPQVELARTANTHRIMNVHRNVPGVLRDINRIVSDRGANIQGQLLATDPDIGYLIMDLNKDVADSVCADMNALSTSIKTRVVYLPGRPRGSPPVSSVLSKDVIDGPLVRVVEHQHPLDGHHAVAKQLVHAYPRFPGLVSEVGVAHVVDPEELQRRHRGVGPRGGLDLGKLLPVIVGHRQETVVARQLVVPVLEVDLQGRPGVDQRAVGAAGSEPAPDVAEIGHLAVQPAHDHHLATQLSHGGPQDTIRGELEKVCPERGGDHVLDARCGVRLW